MELTVPGKVPSKKNRYRIWRDRRTGKPRLGKHPDVTRYERNVTAFATQASVAQGVKLMGPLSIDIEVWVKRISQDVDNMLGAILDGLKNSLLIDDDSQFFDLHIRKRYAQRWPAVVIKITEVNV